MGSARLSTELNLNRVYRCCISAIDLKGGAYRLRGEPDERHGLTIRAMAAGPSSGFACWT